MDNPLSENVPNPSSSEKSFPVPQFLKAKYQDHAGLSRNLKVRSLSRGGICIEDGSCLPVGTCLRFSLNINGKTIEAQGEVAWNSQENKSFLHGIKFTFMEQSGREWLNTFIMDWAAEQIAESMDFSGLEVVHPAIGIERRSFARLNIPLRVEVGFNEAAMLIHTKIYDLSEGGLCLISNFALKKDQEVHLRLWLREKNFTSLVGIVKNHAEKIHENRKVNFHGIEFSKIAPEAAKEIALFLNQKRSELAVIEISLDDIIAQTDVP